MSLAAILGLYFLSLGSLSLGWLPPQASGFAAQPAEQHLPGVTASTLLTPQSQGSATPSQTQPPSSQNAEPTQPLPSPSAETPNSPAQAKPTPARRRRKKTIPSNCSNSPTALNTTVGKPAEPPNSADTGSTDAAATRPSPSDAGPTPSKPCPPPKKVIRNGGSNEPTVELTGGATAEQASDKRSLTEQLAAATEENLKKTAGRQLNPSQQEMVSQIKQFMEQSKAAIATGDLERGHNLALKAHLLSDELVKP
ncbi:MAG: hypothetical protein WB799_23410 [Candidatus Sulfotelmatobacter sp.]